MTQLTYAQLEGVWINNGGNKAMAPLMAAIAEVESSGRTDALNASGATGLWQIEWPLHQGIVPGATSRAALEDPNINAKAAVKLSGNVNSVAPGLTGSPMTAREMSMPGLEDAFLKEYPLGRIGTAEDIANAVLWLASDESFITGQVLQINGGLTLRRNPNPREINASLKAAAAKNSQV